jgi:serine protease Do
VIVTGVVPGSPAAEAGIQPGDLIQSVNRQSVKSADEFERAVKGTRGDKVLLLVKRDEFSRFVIVRFAQ